jgi:hypothetical protein
MELMMSREIALDGDDEIDVERDDDILADS